MDQLVLIGGGHANIQLLKQYRDEPLKNFQVTLISDKAHAAYSGMLAGHILGWYSFELAHFDLAELCKRSGVRFIQRAVTGISSQSKEIFFSETPPLKYDLACIDVGIGPMPIPVTDTPFIPVKPISGFIEKLQKLFDELKSADFKAQPLAIVGGGAAGVELAFALHSKFQSEKLDFPIHILEAQPELVSRFSHAVRRKLEVELKNRGIHWQTNFRVDRIAKGQVIAGDKVLDIAVCIIATSAKAPAWLGDSGLPVDEKGFLQTEADLRVKGETDLFAAGDCIHFLPRELPKAGVYAVRQGEHLKNSIWQRARGAQTLKAYNPQKRALYLISTGEKTVIASYGPFALKARWLWKLKDHIDRSFMTKYKG